MTGAGGGLAVGLLGPLVVSVGGLPVEVRPGRLRALVVALALSAGRTVSVDRLAVAVWEDDLPQDVRGSVQNYVWRLRALLGGGSIGTDGEGYVLRVTPQGVDGLRFVGLLDAAAQLSDTAEQMALLDEALALWRGSPFEGVRSAWLQESEAPRLVERYLAAVERRVDLAVAESRGADLAPQLRVLTAQHPLRESLWARLLVVLDRGGRPAEALERYETIRRRLADELGVDPGPDLQDIYADLLARTTTPQASTTGPAAAVRDTARQVVPRQLPADIDSFAGRDAALAALDALLGEKNESASRPVVIAVIAGTAGVGKTSLAVHWAHRVTDRFPDGQLYVNLRGFDPHGRVTAPADAVRTILDALHVPTQQIPAALEAQVGLYRSLLAGKRVLVVLDNARDAEQVRPLLPGAPGSLVVITSRNQLLSLIAAQAAHPVTLDLLTHDEARQLLARRLGADRIATDPQAVAEIIDRCARLPLALAIVAARAATHPTFDLDQLAAQLHDTRSRLDTLAGEDPVTDVRAVFSWSNHTVTVDAARLFRLLGLHPSPDIATSAAASLAGVPAAQVRPLLTELSRASLLVEHTPGRYIIHDLLRAYAAELADSHDTDAERRAAVHRILDHYLHTAYTAERLLEPNTATIELDPAAAGCHPHPIHDPATAIEWFDAEHRCLLAAQQLAVDQARPRAVWQLAWSMTAFHLRRGHLHDQLIAWQHGLTAAHRLGDQAAQALAHRRLGQAGAEMGKHAEALDHLHQALALTQDSEDIPGQAHTRAALAWAWGQQQNNQQALTHASEALRLYQGLDNPVREADALNQVGWYCALVGDHQQARTLCDAALALYRSHNDRAGEAATLDSLGYIAHHTGQHIQALHHYQQAVTLYRDVGNTYQEANTLGRLGDTHAALRQHNDARDTWQQALQLYQAQDRTPDADQVRTKIHHLDPVDGPETRHNNTRSG